jgi:hypothetical protein
MFSGFIKKVENWKIMAISPNYKNAAMQKLMSLIWGL